MIFWLDCLISLSVDGSALLPVPLAVCQSLPLVSMSQSEDSVNDAVRKHKDIEKNQEILAVDHGALLLLRCNNSFRDVVFL